MATASERASIATSDQSTATFAGAIGRGDLELATRCFTRDACLLTPDATAIRGREEIRPILAQLIARATRIEVHPGSVLVAGEVALIAERWRIQSRGSEGATFEQISVPTVVLQRHENVWKLAILGPWGWGRTGVGL